MTETEKQELRVKVAELCGWTELEWRSAALKGYRPNFKEKGFKVFTFVPNYPNDLNACAEFEKKLTFYQGAVYRQRLTENSDGPDALFPTAEAAMCHATATQRCQAFRKVMEEKR